jgi:hypothetical protein
MYELNGGRNKQYQKLLFPNFIMNSISLVVLFSHANVFKISGIIFIYNYVVTWLLILYKAYLVLCMSVFTYVVISSLTCRIFLGIF